MKFIKWLATLLSAASVLFLLFNVFLGRKINWTRDLQYQLIDMAYIVLGISFLLFIFYYWMNKNKKMMWRWFLLLMVVVAAWLLCAA